MTRRNHPTYQLWSFQTAFRWKYPSVLATGVWTDEFEELVGVERGISTPGTPGAFIDQALWQAVMQTRIDQASGAISTDPGDPLAVYQPPWAFPGAMTAGATEIDLTECVLPVNTEAGTWGTYAEKCTVEVLVHHRDTHPVAVGQTHVVLLWRSDPVLADLTGLAADDLHTYFQQYATTSTVQAPPPGWNLAGPAAGSDAASLTVPLEVRIPRAVSIDVDLSLPNVAVNDLVLFAAFAWSDDDQLTQAAVLPAVANPTVVDLANGWPYLALRMAKVTARPT
jgi:hypothetical protein